MDVKGWKARLLPFLIFIAVGTPLNLFIAFRAWVKMDDSFILDVIQSVVLVLFLIPGSLANIPGFVLAPFFHGNYLLNVLAFSGLFWLLISLAMGKNEVKVNRQNIRGLVWRLFIFSGVYYFTFGTLYDLFWAYVLEKSEWLILGKSYWLFEVLFDDVVLSGGLVAVVSGAYLGASFLVEQISNKSKGLITQHN